jgi:hypothetical protein
MSIPLLPPPPSPQYAATIFAHAVDAATNTANDAAIAIAYAEKYESHLSKKEIIKAAIGDYEYMEELRGVNELFSRPLGVEHREWFRFGIEKITTILTESGLQWVLDCYNRINQDRIDNDLINLLINNAPEYYNISTDSVEQNKPELGDQDIKGQKQKRIIKQKSKIIRPLPPENVANRNPVGYEDLTQFLYDGDFNVVYADDAIIHSARLQINGNYNPPPQNVDEPDAIILLMAGLFFSLCVGANKSGRCVC